MKWYLAGPMSGIPQFNFPAFDAAAEKLRNIGHKVISPAELDDPVIRAECMASPDGAPLKRSGGSWGHFLSRDVRIVADEVQGIILLNGWERSKGARLELTVALLCGHEVALYTGAGIYRMTRREALSAMAHQWAIDHSEQARRRCGV